MNPYEVLGIGPEASGRDIVQATARAMRERAYGTRDISLAQKMLMNPISQAVERFICVLDVKPLLEKHRSEIPEEAFRIEKQVRELKHLPFPE